MRLFYLFFFLFFISNCTIYENNIDNPNDNEANEELGVFPPSLVFFPKQQTKTQKRQTKTKTTGKT